MPEVKVSVQEMMKARASAIAEAKKEGILAKEVPIPPVNDLQGKVATGLMGSAEVNNLPSYNVPAAPVGQINQELAKQSRAVFKQIHLHKLILGPNVIRPVDGYFYAKNDKEVAAFLHQEKAGRVSQVHIPLPGNPGK